MYKIRTAVTFMVTRRHRHSVFRFFVILYLGLSSVTSASAMTPQAVFQRTQKDIFVLDVLDKNGDIYSVHSAVSFGQDTAATQCDLVRQASALRLRRGESSFVASISQKDSARNLCLLSAPGIGKSGIAVKEEIPAAGTSVYAVSNALGLGISITEGVVSAVREYRNGSYIQFTAAIAPGSEGGGLFDASGKLLGLIIYQQRDGQNVNFARPVKWLSEIEQRATNIDLTETWRNKASLLAKEEKWDDLAKHAAAWTKALTDSAEAWFWLGEAQSRRKDLAAAEMAYREVLKLEPSASRAAAILSKILLEQKKSQDALDVARGMLAYRSEDADIWIAIGNAAVALNLQEDAQKAFAYAVQLAPSNRDAYAGLVNIAGQRGDRLGAVSAQRHIVQIEPQNPANWMLLAGLYSKDGRPERALASAERALSLAPDNGDAWQMKAATLYGLRRNQEAIAALRKSLDLKPSNLASVWAWLADIYFEIQLFPEAIACYQRALELTPNDTALKGRYGIALKDSLQLSEAMAVFEKLRDGAPQDPFAWRQIGFVYGYRGQADAAILAFEKSLSLDHQQPRVWNALMETYHWAGRRDDVRRAYQKLLELDAKLAEQAYRKLIFPYGDNP